MFDSEMEEKDLKNGAPKSRSSTLIPIFFSKDLSRFPIKILFFALPTERRPPSLLGAPQPLMPDGHLSLPPSPPFRHPPTERTSLGVKEGKRKEEEGGPYRRPLACLLNPTFPSS